MKMPNGNEKAKSMYEVGERIGQLIIMPYPKIEFEEVDELPTTERGDGGFGSTGF
jgi:dUTP pyrophosphatase